MTFAKAGSLLEALNVKSQVRKSLIRKRRWGICPRTKSEPASSRLDRKKVILDRVDLKYQK